MTKAERLIKAGQMYSYEDWYAIVGGAYELGLNKNNPKEDYAKYVEETMAQFPD